MPVRECIRVVNKGPRAAATPNLIDDGFLISKTAVYLDGTCCVRLNLDR